MYVRTAREVPRSMRIAQPARGVVGAGGVLHAYIHIHVHLKTGLHPSNMASFHSACDAAQCVSGLVPNARIQ